ncbi:cuticle protein-like isoform X1 [Uranotaenia lowii]|uniref:cuticle protein-like isoform X1 n=1 Tax=Uranotaenia lowii TaxID=190385 RepID=UPI002479C644|nr:cuticle protein-like isoform X1 [Uranotaenia lowii]
MAFKFVTFLALVAVARAGLIASPAVSYGAAPALAYAAPVQQLAYAAPLAKTVVAKQVIADEYDPNPQYSFSYGISDALTGDQKSQQESRQGDVVQGSYSVVDPDGVKRTVEYTADPHNGFNAVVHRQPLAAKAVVAAPVIAAKTVIAQPAIAKTVIAQPAYASYAAPVAKTYVSQPAYASYAAPLATKTIVSQPAYASYSAPLATKTIVSQPAYASYAAPATYAYHH